MKKVHTNIKHTPITYRQLFAYIKNHKLSVDDPIMIMDGDRTIYSIDKLAISDKDELIVNLDENTCLLVVDIQ